MPPRVLVVRSGTRSVLEGGSPEGLEVAERVSHAVEAVEPPPSALEAAADLAIFTSRIAVERGLAGAAGEVLRRRLAGARLIAVGPSTARALRDAGLEPSAVADGSAKSILEGLPARLEGLRVLLPCGADADPGLPDALRERGAAVERRVVYRKVAHPPDASLASEFVERPFAAFCATSPAAARWLWRSLDEAGRRRLRQTPAVALGPSTRAALAELGVARVSVAPEASFREALLLLAALAAGAEGT